MQKAIQSEIEVLQAKIKTLESWSPAAEIVVKIAADFSELRTQVSAAIDIGQLRGIIVHHHPTELSQMTPVLKAYSKAGFHIKKEPIDYAEIKRRHWELTHEETKAPLIVTAFFEGDKTKCEFKKVGQKVEDVFELVCN